MKIMFVIHNYLPYIDATVRIVSNISEYLSNQGVEISILTYKTDGSAYEEIIGGQKIYRVEMSFFSRLFRRAIKIFLKEWNYRNTAIEKEVAKLNQKNEFDFVIPVIQSKMNAVSVLAASRKDSKMKFAPYFVDPFSTYADENIHTEFVIKLESEIYKRCLKAFVTHEIYTENKKNSFRCYLNKMQPLHFPNIRKLNKLTAKDDIIFNKKYINCTYIGYTYSNIRNTKFFFTLLKLCKNTDIIFHLVGGSYGYDQDLEEAKQVLGEKFVIHGKVSGQAAVNALIDSDILINIGNNVTNMLPSKILEYFSSGKPIINTCKNKECPTLKLTKNYPICLDLFEQQDITDETVKRFENFCIENKDKTIPYEDIKAIYGEHTIESVGAKFLHILNEVKGENT